MEWAPKPPQTPRLRQPHVCGSQYSPSFHFLLLRNFGAPQTHATSFAYKPPPAPTPPSTPVLTSAWCCAHIPTLTYASVHCSSGGLTDPVLGTQPITRASPAPNIGLNPWPPLQHAFLLPARTWNRLITRGGVSNALFLSRLGVPRPLLSGEQALQAPSPVRLLSESPKAT